MDVPERQAGGVGGTGPHWEQRAKATIQGEAPHFPNFWMLFYF